jgi:hypothetical protein
MSLAKRVESGSEPHLYLRTARDLQYKGHTVPCVRVNPLSADERLSSETRPMKLFVYVQLCSNLRLGYLCSGQGEWK